MKKLVTLLLSITAMVIFSVNVNAQCSTDQCTIPIAAYDAPSACILSSEHDLDCYFGQTSTNVPISLPPYWCTSIENNQWFAFIASSTNVSFQIEASNCTSGGAVQAAILETNDCIDFTFVSDCLGNIVDGTTQTLTNNIPLTIGQVYYLMIDGSAGAQCGFSINGPSVITSGPEAVCLPGGPFTYYTNSPAIWSVSPSNMGNILGDNIGTSVTVSWVEVGNAQICAENISCPSAPIFCKDISVGEYQHGEHTHYLCAGGSVTCGGLTFIAPGIYQNSVPSPSGCDSLITCVIIAIPPILTNLGEVPLPCNGTYSACGETYSIAGQYITFCTSWHGCDSLVSFTLVADEAFASAGAPVSLGCGANTTAVLDGSNSSQGANFGYSWTTTNGHIVSGDSTDIAVVGQTGTYCLTVTNLSTGCMMTDCTEVVEEEISTFTKDTICLGEEYDFNGQFLTTAGTYESVLSSYLGCDSVVTLTLVVNPTSGTTNNLEVYQGYVHHGVIILADTVLVENLVNRYGCDSTVVFNFTVVPSSTQDLSAQMNFEVFPNPTTEHFSVRFSLSHPSDVRLKVMDVMSRQVQLHLVETNFSTGEHLLEMKAQEWPSGVYLIHCQTNTGTVVKKLLVN